MNTRVEAAVAELAAAIEEIVETATRRKAGPPELLSIEEAARRLGIGRTALYHELTNGSLRSFKVGRRRLIPASSIYAYIDAQVQEVPRAEVAGLQTTRGAGEWSR